MAIPLGTTSRNIRTLGALLLAGLAVSLAGLFWQPSFHGWGLLIGGLLLAWILWMLSQVAAGDRTVAGHPLQWVLLALAAAMVLPLGLSRWSFSTDALDGSMNISLVLQVMLLSLGVMVVQEFWGGRGVGLAMAAVAAAGVIVSSVVAAFAGGANVLDTVPLTGLAACAGLLACGCKLAAGARSAAAKATVIMVVGAPSVAGAVLLCWQGPQIILLAAAVVLAAGLIFLVFRGSLLVRIFAIAGLAAMGLATLVYCGLRAPAWLSAYGLWGGQGGGWQFIPAQTRGAAVIRQLGGYPAVIIAILGPAACLAWLAIRSRGERAGALLWSMACGLSLAALLESGGLFVPSTLMVAALTWGMLPAMAGVVSGRGSGLLVLLVFWAALMLVGLGSGHNVVVWGAAAFRNDDGFLHFVAGLLMAMSLAWFAGARWIVLGLLAAGVSVLLGAIGELGQLVLSNRNAQWNDFLTHAMGSVIGGAAYLLAGLSKWAESRDARAMPKL